MSKRFGRNQKRRLTEQLTLAQNTNEALGKQLVSCQKEVVRLRTEIRDIHSEICEAFNEYHPLLNKTMSVDRPDMERIQIAQYERFPFNVNSLDANPIEFKHRIVHLLRIESWPEKYQRGMAFKARYKDKVVGYFTSDLDLISRRDSIGYMAEHIARELDNHMRKSQ
ncbi:MAG: hypothetical protein [Podoviridae sp. ctpVR23]|nr:MAG: hypothetical protein [Podoviridae sp. ctpVR23]